MKHLLFITLLGLTQLSSFSQQYIYRGTKRIPATGTWDFSANNYPGTGSLQVKVGKEQKGGVLMLSIGVPMQFQSIAGSVLLYLEDGKVIVLPARVASDHVDESSTVLYSISPSQMEALANSNIETIRFSVKTFFPKGTPRMAADNSESYTANNRPLYGETQSPTADEIRTLISEK